MTPSIIKHDRIRSDDGGAQRGAPTDTVCAPARPRAAKGVRLLERDGQVHAIELTCGCGEVSVVELDYTGAPATQTTQSPQRAEETQ